MEVDPLETVETAEANARKARDEHEERVRRRLNRAVAITIALLATFMGICKVKDDNIVQAMQQAQADKIDYWNWYQARHVRMEVDETAAAQMRALAGAAAPGARVGYLQQAAAFDRLAKEQAEKMAALQKKSDGFDTTYNAFNFHDDQFDLCDAGLTIAISMLALTALTEIPWLFFLALLPASFGILMGLAGLLGWSLHPDMLAKMLGT